MNRITRAWLTPALALGLTLGSMSIAGAQATDGNKTESTKKAKPEAAKPADPPAPDKAEPDKAEPDNTKTNKRDRDGNSPTADQQKNNKSDVSVAAEIRRAIVADKSLSTSAHNVKIIAESGMVTLKGPVHSDAEKATIEQKAVAVVGQAKVSNQIEVKP